MKFRKFESGFENLESRILLTGNETSGLSVKVLDSSAIEGEQVVIRAQLSEPVNKAVFVQFETVPATARPDDFQVSKGSFRFGPGQSESFVIIPTREDQVIEGDEHFRVQISPPEDMVAIRDIGYATIREDDLEPELVVHDLGESVLLSLSNPYDKAVEVLANEKSLATLGGRIGHRFVDRADFQSEVGRARGPMNLQMRVGDAPAKSLPDPATRAIEALFQTGISPTPPLAGITVADSAEEEGDTLSFSVGFAPTSNCTAATLDYWIVDQTTESNDYSASMTGSLSFSSPNVTPVFKTISVPTNENSYIEADETFKIVYGVSPSCATIADDGEAIGTIINDDEVNIRLFNFDEPEEDDPGIQLQLNHFHNDPNFNASNILAPLRLINANPEALAGNDNGNHYTIGYDSSRLKVWNNQQKSVHIPSGSTLSNTLYYVEGIGNEENSSVLHGESILSVTFDTPSGVPITDSNGQDSADSVDITVVSTKVNHVIPFIYADADYSVPVGFEFHGPANHDGKTVHRARVEFYVNDSMKFWYETSTRFGAVYGNTVMNPRTTEGEETYYVFVPASMFKGVNVTSDSSDDVYFRVWADTSLEPNSTQHTTMDIPQQGSNNSALVFADKDVESLDGPAQHATNGAHYVNSDETIDLDSSKQNTGLDSESTKYYEYSSTQNKFVPIETLSQYNVTASASAENKSDGLEASSELDECKIWVDTHYVPCSIGGSWSHSFPDTQAVSIATEGIYVFPSYGGKRVSWLGGELYRSSDLASFNYNVDWFSGASFDVQTSSNAQAAWDTATIAAGVGWALLPLGAGPSALGTFMNGVAAASGLANVVLGSLSGPAASGTTSGAYYQGLTTQHYYASQTSGVDSTVQAIFDDTSPVGFADNGEGTHVGAQLVFVSVVTAWSKKVNLNDTKIEADLQVEGFDWHTVDVTLTRGW